MNTETILGYTVVSDPIGIVQDDILDHLATGSSCKYLSCFNPHSYAIAKDMPAFQNALKSSAWLVPDGVGVVYASRALSGKIRQRITGFDVFDGVCAGLENKQSGSVFFLGASNDTLVKIRAKFNVDFPHVTIAGTYSPPFKSEFTQEDTNAMIQAVNEAKPDVLWLGMTSPKQDLWLYENRDRLNVRFAAAIGAVFDFYCGNVKRSHPIFQKCGLEWLPRLVQQPKRLWKRMFVSAPIFVVDVMKIRKI